MATITDQQLLEGLQQAYLNLATSGAQSYTIFGRTYNRLDMKELQQQIIWLEGRIDTANNPGIGGGTVLVRMGQLY